MARSPAGSSRGGIAVDISALGIPDVQAKLSKFGVVMQRKIVRRALRDAAKEHVKPRADANIAAVSPGVEGTGKLRSFGTAVRARRPKRGFFGVETRTATREQLGIEPDHAYYPAILEFGDAERGIEPRRMLRRARNEAKSLVLRSIASDIRRMVNLAVRTLRGGQR